MRLFKYIWMLFLTSSFCKEEIYNNSKVFVDFLNEFFSTDTPFGFYGCWKNRYEKRYFLSKIYDKNLGNVYFQNKNINSGDANYKWSVLDALSCNITIYLIEINNIDGYLLPNKHLIAILEQDYDYYKRLLKSFSILPMSEVWLAIIKENEISISSIYKIRQHTTLEIEPRGTWSSQSGFSKPLVRHFRASLRMNFKRQPIYMGTVLFTNKNAADNVDFDYLGPNNDFNFLQEMPTINGLIQYLNATLNMTIYDSHGYGNYVEYLGEKKLKVMIPDLIENKIDVGGTNLVTKHRLNSIAYAGPLNLLGLKLFLKKPSLSYVTNIYVLTLSLHVWIATFITTILLMVALYFSLNWEVKLCAEQKPEIAARNMNPVSISDMVVLSLEGICQQGTNVEPVSISGRILLILFFLFYMFIFVAYSASILILLKSSAKIQSASDLLEYKFEVGVINRTFSKHIFNELKGGVFKELYDKKIKPNNFFEIREGYEKIRDGHFAYLCTEAHASLSTMRKFTNYDVCAFQSIPSFITGKTYVPVPKNSGYMELIKVGLLIMHERGITERAKFRTVRKPICNNAVGNFESIKIDDCQYVIIIYFYGIILSLLILVLEKIIKIYVDYRRFHNF